MCPRNSAVTSVLAQLYELLGLAAGVVHSRIWGGWSPSSLQIKHYDARLGKYSIFSMNFGPLYSGEGRRRGLSVFLAVRL